MREWRELEADSRCLQRRLDLLDPAMTSIATRAYLHDGSVARALHCCGEVHLDAIHADAIAAADPDDDLVGSLRGVTRFAAGFARATTAPEPPDKRRAGADEREDKAGVAFVVCRHSKTLHERMNPQKRRRDRGPGSRERRSSRSGVWLSFSVRAFCVISQAVS